MPLVDFFCETCAQPRLLGWWGQLKRALSRELTQLSERSRSGAHVTSFITAAFLDPQSEVDLPPPPPPKEPEPPPHSGGGGQGGHPLPPPPADPIPRFGVSTEQEELLAEELRSLNEWGLNIFRVAQYSHNRSLSCIIYSVFQERGLPRRFGIPLPVLLRFSRALEERYRRDVAYHCSLHAADVLHAAHVLLRCNALRAAFSELEVLAALFAAAIHDVDHPGVTNQFLISTNSALARLYEAQSVLEQHHVAVGFRLLREDGCDIFQNLSAAQRRRLRAIVTDVVLATDMAKHAALLSDLRAVVDSRQRSSTGALQLNSDSARIQVLRAVVHCADLSNPTRALELYRQWSARIMEEFFVQGDRERMRGMAVSAMCDRHCASEDRAQVCFIEEVVQPLWETWAALVRPEAQEMLRALHSNHQWYRQRIPPPPPRTPPHPEGAALS
ncbi:3',5'-cyclic-AMP phosphodiesterase 4A-like [Cyrtonyx montezumae]|uniref:3',5'-cyclic-AMP phosphodiesterase 4A-like n=1 Tax=Cyrtonyx montezumae TaxID=9017 RepID=UPI0032DA81D9